MVRTIKPKYYLRQSQRAGGDWWYICQVYNNVEVAEIQPRVLADMFLSYLNSLAWRELPKVRVTGPYTHIKRSKNDEK